MHVMLAVHCFFPSHFYGTETYTLELARGLMGRGHRVTVLSAVHSGEPQQEAEVIHYDFQGIPVISVDKNFRPNTRIRDTYYQPEHRTTLQRVLRDEKPEVLHVTHLINHTGTLIEAAVVEDIPIMATFTDFFGFCYNCRLEATDGSHCRGPNERRTNCLACHLKLAHMPSMPMMATACWALTRLPAFNRGPLARIVSDINQRPNILQALYRHYRLAISPTAFLREAYQANACCVPLHDIRFGTDIDRTPKPAAPAASPLRVGFIGQIAPHKGPDLLIDAVRACRPSSVQCTIHGPSDREPAYMKELHRRALGLPVEFPGTFHPRDMALILAGFDLLVIPSRWYENSPLVLLDALATHTPVIVSDARGLMEFVTPGQNGFSFPLGDGKVLALLLRELADNPERVRNMSQDTSYPRTIGDMVVDTERLQFLAIENKR
jgi:glycosyltransferase involved in cell wall biosynthesis